MQTVILTITSLPHAVSASEPVRSLRCNYDALKKEKALSCVWLAPEQAYAHIQAYDVNVTRDGNVILEMSTRTPRLESNVKLTQGEVYMVSVRAVTLMKGVIARTAVNFINSGMSNFTF